MNAGLRYRLMNVGYSKSTFLTVYLYKYIEMFSENVFQNDFFQLYKNIHNIC
uniref:Uncharacterized protein n=2 Tax=Anguilla anguilla TaxID=7936 RepID=A0A0E9PMY5_ANGAN